MDEFDIVTEVGKGTTVTMTKWRSRPERPGRPEQDSWLERDS